MPRLFFAVVITKITHNIVEAGNGEQCARMKHWIGGARHLGSSVGAPLLTK